MDTTSNVSVCGDLYPSAQRSNAVSNSDWTLTYTTGSGIDVVSKNMGSTGALATTWTLGFPYMFTAWIDVNTEYTFGDYQYDVVPSMIMNPS